MKHVSKYQVDIVRKKIGIFKIANKAQIKNDTQGYQQFFYCQTGLSSLSGNEKIHQNRIDDQF